MAKLVRVRRNMLVAALNEAYSQHLKVRQLSEEISTLREANRQKQALIEHISAQLDRLIAKCEEAQP